MRTCEGNSQLPGTLFDVIRWTPICVALAFLLASGCSQTGQTRAADSDGSSPSPIASSTEPAEAELVVLTDPVEKAFTLQMPKGWQNLAYLARSYDLSRTVAIAQSPDRNTVIYLGDASLPYYTTPDAPGSQYVKQMAKFNPMVDVLEYHTAEEFVVAYIEEEFGDLPGFEIIESGPDPSEQQRLTERLQKKGMSFDLSAATAKFTFTDNGTPMYALVLCATGRAGYSWFPEVSGVCTTGDPQKYKPLIIRIAESYQAQPEWEAKEKRTQEARRAEILRQGANNLDWIRQSSIRHQARMDAIRAFGDASMRRYYERDAASDRSHRQFINQINDETTVIDPDGRTRQVDNRYDRYFMHKQNGSYVGGDSHTDLEDLRKLGLNPYDYEEVQIKK